MTTYERLQQMLATEYNLRPEKLTLAARLEELGIDSLGVMELLFKVEEEFHVRLPTELEELTTVGEVVNYIDRLVAAQSGAGASAETAS